MTDAERVKEWEHCYTLLMTDQSRVALFIELKKKRTAGDKIAGEALGRIVTRWLRES